MKNEDMYSFYIETSFAKKILWVIFTFVWIIVTFLLTDVNTGWFDGFIERTNIYFFYVFWVGASISTYIFLYVNVYKKENKKMRSFAICVIAIVSMMALSGFSVKLSACTYKHFSKDTWRECKNTRKYMIYDLINNHDIIGMKVDEAIKLLGEPDSYYNSQISNGKGITYLSGRKTYVIIFGIENNKIVDYCIY